MIKKNMFSPRNKNIEENEDHENKVIAKQQVEGTKRAKKIDDLIDMGKEEETEVSKAEEDVKELSKFIEIIIRMPKS